MKITNKIVEKHGLKIEEFENINSYLYSIEALMEKIFDIKAAKNVEVEF